MFAKLLALSVGKKIALGGVGLFTVAAIAGGSAPQQPNSAQQKTDKNQTQNSEVKGTSDTKKPTIETKEVVVTEPVPFSKTTVNSAAMASGTSKVTTTGVNGLKTKVYAVTYSNGVETTRILKSEKVTVEPIAEVTTIGTYIAPKPASNCDPNYSPCVPNVSYDLDCADVGFSVTVIGYDKHRLDGDDDGAGCESY